LAVFVPVLELIRARALAPSSAAALDRFVDDPGAPEPRMRCFRLQVKAEALAWAGCDAAALDAMAAAVDEGLLDLPWLDRCPLLAPVRGEPRVAEMRARVAARIDPIRRAFGA
jgi:serine/threonine-protein kinase